MKNVCHHNYKNTCYIWAKLKHTNPKMVCRFGVHLDIVHVAEPAEKPA